MLPDEVREAVAGWESLEVDHEPDGWPAVRMRELTAVRAHLLAREAEVERLRAIEKERWDVVATRNAAAMRAERAEALLRECLTVMELHPATHNRITAHLGAEQ